MVQSIYSFRDALVITSFVLILVPGLATAQNGPSAAKRPPAVEVTYPNTTYDSEVRAIGEVDFTNFEYRIGGQQIRLTKGAYHMHEDFSFEDAKLERVWPFDTPDGQHHALVFLDDVSGGGSSNDTGLVLVFGVRGNHPVVTQEMSFDRQAEGTGVAFDPALRRLVVKARSNDDSPHCCAKSVDEVTYTWGAKGFTQAALRVVPLIRK
jgi:hypothetical protein